MCLEALFGDSVVGFELDSHIVELGRDHLGHFGTTKLAVQLRLGGQATPDLHVIVFADLGKNGYCSHQIQKYQRTDIYFLHFTFQIQSTFSIILY